MEELNQHNGIVIVMTFPRSRNDIHIHIVQRISMYTEVMKFSLVYFALRWDFMKYLITLRFKYMYSMFLILI